MIINPRWSLLSFWIFWHSRVLTVFGFPGNCDSREAAASLMLLANGSFPLLFRILWRISRELVSGLFHYFSRFVFDHLQVRFLSAFVICVYPGRVYTVIQQISGWYKRKWPLAGCLACLRLCVRALCVSLACFNAFGGRCGKRKKIKNEIKS